ncbi:MAG: arginine deiminase-related protein [Agriterribacter sp.]
MQTTSHILMIKPVNFSFNAETAINNAFQVAGQTEAAQEKALQEFNDFVQKLRNLRVEVTVMEDTPVPYTPDSIFPNNWISFHNGTICLYPMYAVNRRNERKPELINKLMTAFNIQNIVDFTAYEQQQIFLEGTGSMVLDRDYHIAYACLSPRTDKSVLEDFCVKMKYTPVVFDAADEKNQPIYHTNVMMCVADRYVVICLDSITDSAQKENVIKAIQQSGKKIITITIAQMNHFAGNMLQVQNKNGEKFLVMSSQAYQSLTAQQVKELAAYNPIIHSSLLTIETNGGGSARCMMAEVFL